MKSSCRSLDPCGQGYLDVGLPVLPAEAVQGEGGFCQTETGTMFGKYLWPVFLEP